MNGWPRLQVVKDLGVKGLRVTVRPGRVFKNSQATRQDVVAQELVGELATPGANRFEPTDLMVLNDYDPHYFLVRVFCLQFRRDMLGEGLSMSIAGTAPAAVVLVVRAITSETLPIAQAGISAVTGNITKEELASSGPPLSPSDVERVRVLLLRAGLNPSQYQLTG